MTDISAALGISQLEKYDTLLEKRRQIVSMYDSMCDELGVYHLNHITEASSSSAHLYITRIPGITAEQRNAIISEMAEKGVACNVHYKPLQMMTAYKKIGFDISDYPNAYNYFSNEITLPLYTKLTEEDAYYVCECFKEIVSKYKV